LFQIGEFSFILADLGIKLKVLPEAGYVQSSLPRKKLIDAEGILAAYVCVRSGKISAYGRAEDYRRYAAECLRIAQTISSPSEKSVLLQMAETWQRLASQIELRNTR
jgi:hypothetical protein